MIMQQKLVFNFFIFTPISLPLKTCRHYFYFTFDLYMVQ